MTTTAATRIVPQSWAVQHWPEDIYPGTPARGKYVYRQHRDELLAVGALAEQTDRVADFPIAPNRSQEGRACAR
jgi:hypothetical protein